jgi:hypothetical protein
MDIKDQAIKLLQKSSKEHEFMALIFKGDNGELISNCGEETIVSIIGTLVKKLFSENMCCEAHFMQLNILLVETIKAQVDNALSKGFDSKEQVH